MLKEKLEVSRFSGRAVTPTALLSFVLLLILVTTVFSSMATVTDSADAEVVFLGVPEIVIDDVIVFEGEVANFTVTLSSPSSSVITVDFSTVDDVALAGSDYLSASGTVVFQPGETEKIVQVDTIEDDTDEPDETFFVDLSNVQGPAEIVDPRGVGTILDDEGIPSIIIGDDVVEEGNPEEFIVSLSNPSTETVTVNYSTSDGTAVAGEDYPASTGTITFQPGETEKTITIPTIEDDVDEPDETFDVNLTGVVGPAYIVDGVGVGTILDNDEEEQAGGAAGIESCGPICPPTLPANKATKQDELIEDHNDNKVADPGDLLKYTIKIREIYPSQSGKLTYVEPISQNLNIRKGSIRAPSGKVSLQNKNGAQILKVTFPGTKGEAESAYTLRIEYDAKIVDDLPEETGYVLGQGTVYSEGGPTVVTDDPDTDYLDDPTVTFFSFEPDRGSPVVLDRQPIKVEKDVVSRRFSGTNRTPPESNGGRRFDRLVYPGTEVKLKLTIENTGLQPLDGVKLIDLVDSHLVIDPETIKVNGKEKIDPEFSQEMGTLSLKLPQLSVGGSHVVTYWLRVEESLGRSVGYLGTRAMVSDEFGPLSLSDDPDTEIEGDRTTLLLPNLCDYQNYVDEWDRWFKKINSSMPSAMVPALFEEGVRSLIKKQVEAGKGSFTTEKAGRTKNPDEERQRQEKGELAWVLYTNEYFTKGSLCEGGYCYSSTRWPKFVFYGAGEFSLGRRFESLLVTTDQKRIRGTAGGTAAANGQKIERLYAQRSLTEPVFASIFGTGGFTIEGPSEGNRLCGEGYLPLVARLKLAGGQACDLEPRGEAGAVIDLIVPSNRKEGTS